MPIDVTMPKLSDTMEEGKVLQWLKHPGDTIAIGDIIAEVETDKATMELEAYDEGVLSEVKVREGDSVPVGSVIAVLRAPGEAQAAAPAARAAAPSAGDREHARSDAPPGGAREPAKATRPDPDPGAARGEPERGVPRAEPPRGEPWRPTVVARRPEPAAPASGRRVKASPLARRIAADHGLDLGTIAGSGPEGRIVEKDVEAALARGGEAAPGEKGGGTAAEPGRQPAPEPQRPAPGPTAEGRVELSRIRRTTAKRMGEAKREVPHFYVSADVRMDEAVRLKESLVALGGDFAGATYTHLLVKAAAIALTRVPEVNAAYDGDAIVLHERANVGVATAVDEGLLVPVVHDAARLPLAAIVKRVRELVERAKAGRFQGDDLSGATFTISNLGMFPVSEFAAVVNQPQAAILAVGAIRDVPVVDDGRVVPGRMMTVTLSSDHRIIDGVLAARFLRELKTLLERPVALVV
ncbi:MAG TPA: dihydrolipoamide acetyltransferase family protein [Candidatus Binatia bacterium]|nr:dihydrolipoamide acetyltransferase family protein [Candidatus Binatia bacterium]